MEIYTIRDGDRTPVDLTQVNRTQFDRTPVENRRRRVKQQTLRRGRRLGSKVDYSASLNDHPALDCPSCLEEEDQLPRGNGSTSPNTRFVDNATSLLVADSPSPSPSPSHSLLVPPS